MKTAAILIVLTAEFIPAALCQESATAQTDQQQSAPGVRFSLDMTSRAGTYTYVPGEWGELHLRLENGENTAQELLSTTYFEKTPGLQFARQISVPAHSRLRISHPILFPKADGAEDRSIKVRSLMVQSAPGSEVLLRNDSGQLQHERSLLITPPGRNTGLVLSDSMSEFAQQEVVDLIVANRVFQGLDNKVTLLADQFLPSDPTSLNYLDHLILAEDRLGNDFAAMTAVRRWLHAGGRLWIMLDRTAPDLLYRLFGDEFQGSVVDRVGLNTVRLDKPPSVFVPQGEVGATIEYENPVDLSRTIVSDMKVINTVNGWPAALTGTFGRGRILITTLGPRGWMKTAPETATPAPPSNGKPRPPRPVSAFVPLPPMEDLAPWIFGEPETEPLAREVMESYAKEYVSYKVPTWVMIIGTMAGFLAALAISGIWLWKKGVPEHFGWSGSLLAVLFGAVFVGIGIANRYGVPETISSVYFARAIGGTDDIWASGVMAVYRREGGQSLIGSSHGGELEPDLKGSEGSTVRMVTSDLGKFQWNGFSQPAGIGIYPAVTSRSLSSRIAARATIDAQGVTGSFSGPSLVGANALIATRQGRIGVELTSDGQFTAGADSVLNPDQYLKTTFLNDIQDRRRRILKNLFENPGWQSSLDRPQLMLWLKDWDHGFHFGDGLEPQGDTLLTVPLELRRPPAGTEMTIPSPLLNFGSCQPPDNSPAAGFWDDDRREWQERSTPSATWLSVQIPEPLLPVTASQALIRVEVSGAMGKFELMGVKNGAVVTLESVTDPVGTLSFTIDDPEILTVSRTGELILGLSAGIPIQSQDSQNGTGAATAGNSQESPAGLPAGSGPPGLGAAGSANYWRIESFSVQLQARVSESLKKN